MKKFLMLAAFAVSALGASAQLWIGGNIGYNYDKSMDYDFGRKFKTHTISISPEIGYNISDKWAFAVNIDYSFEKVVDGWNAHALIINPYARFTFAKAGIASFFVDGGIEGGMEKFDNLDATEIIGVGFQPGVALKISDHVCFVTKLGYLGYRHTDDSDQFGFGVNNELITFGAYYSF